MSPASATGPVDADACTLFQRTVELAGRRWSGAILFAAVAGARRFVEYRRAVHGISDRLLTQRLRELERQGFIAREVVWLVLCGVALLVSLTGAAGGTTPATVALLMTEHLVVGAVIALGLRRA